MHTSTVGLEPPGHCRWATLQSHSTSQGPGAKRLGPDAARGAGWLVCIPGRPLAGLAWVEAKTGGRLARRHLPDPATHQSSLATVHAQVMCPLTRLGTGPCFRLVFQLLELADLRIVNERRAAAPAHTLATPPTYAHFIFRVLQRFSHRATGRTSVQSGWTLHPTHATITAGPPPWQPGEVPLLTRKGHRSKRACRTIR